MTFSTIHGFADFCRELRRAGFSVGSWTGNDEGIFSLNPWFGDNVHWHTGDPETDPWQWRIRAVTECDDIAYAKLFFRKSGWITRDLYPVLMAVRRRHRSFDEWYYDGLISDMEKRIYRAVADTEAGGKFPSLADLKRLTGCHKADQARFDAALTSLQMRMFLSIAGETYRISQAGQAYGWPITTFRLADRLFGEDVFAASCRIGLTEASISLTEHIGQLNPEASETSIRKFMIG